MSVSTDDNDFLSALEAAQPPINGSPILDMSMEDIESTVEEDERRWFIKTAKKSYEFNKKSIIIRSLY